MRLRSVSLASFFPQVSDNFEWCGPELRCLTNDMSAKDTSMNECRGARGLEVRFVWKLLFTGGTDGT